MAAAPEDRDPAVIAALVKKYEAEARNAEADASETRHRARYAKVEADAHELDWLSKSEGHRLAMNSDHFHRVLRFTKGVDEASVKDAVEQLSKWSRIDPGCAITIIFTSPGGSVFSGYAMFDHILELRGRGHAVKTVCRGYAASMAAILMQAGTTRAMGKESFLMLHEISTMAVGKAFEIQDEAAFLEMAMDRVYDIFVDRSDGRLTKSKLKKLVERRDFWVPSDQALKLGLIDGVE